MGSGAGTAAFFFALIFVGVFAGAEASSGQLGIDVSLISGLSGGRCNGSIADCLGEDEFEMGSEASRRILKSYSGITKQVVNSRGPPSPAPSNKPYTKGCPVYRC